MPMGLIISPLIWQSYINAVLDCLQGRKYCDTIMDDLLLFMSSKELHVKIGGSTKGITKEWT